MTRALPTAAPSILSLPIGDVVPIPTLPLAATLTLSVPAVEIASTSAPVPNMPVLGSEEKVNEGDAALPLAA